MASEDTLLGNDFRFQIGDGGSPEAFSNMCATIDIGGLGAEKPLAMAGRVECVSVLIECASGKGSSATGQPRQPSGRCLALGGRVEQACPAMREMRCLGGGMRARAL